MASPSQPKRQKLDDAAAEVENPPEASASTSTLEPGKKEESDKSEPKRKAATSKAPAAKAPRKPRETQLEKVNRLLIKAGYPNPEGASKCGRAGLIRGHYGFKFTGESAQLDVVFLEKKCDYCDSGTVKATVRHALDQDDYGGDYEDGSERAAATCDSCEGRFYVTRCCSGKDMSIDCGKFHNHCEQCPGFGKCLGDYREGHCERCGKHFWGGGDGECPCTSRFHYVSGLSMLQAAMMMTMLMADDSSESDESSDEDGPNDCVMM